MAVPEPIGPHWIAVTGISGVSGGGGGGEVTVEPPVDLAITPT